MTGDRVARNATQLIITAFCALTISIGVCSAGLRAEPGGATPGHTLQTVARFPVYLTRSRVLAILQVGDRPPAPVIFDTGANGNILDTSFAVAMGLPNLGTITSRDGATGTSVPGFTTNIALARLGGVPLADVQANVIEHKETDNVGIVGPNTFSGRLLFLDLSNGRVFLEPRTDHAIPSGRPYPYLGPPGHRLPAIDVNLPGMTVQALLDSGSDRSTFDLPLALAKKVPLVGALRRVGTAHSIGGDQPTYEGQVKGTVRIGPLVLHDPKVNFDGLTPNVGLHFMRQMSILMDPQGERTWLVRPTALSALAQRGYTGRYGVRSVRSEHGRLIFQRDGRPSLPLVALAPDLFELADTDILVHFIREGRRVEGFEQVLEDGEVVPSMRTDPP